jgi:hypothetical protein
LGQGSKKIKSPPGITGSINKILLLGSSHARKIGPMLGQTLGKKFDIVSIAKPNAPLSNDAEVLGKVVKILPSRITLGVPGNSLVRNYNYSIEKDINFIAERTNKQTL